MPPSHNFCPRILSVAEARRILLPSKTFSADHLDHNILFSKDFIFKNKTSWRVIWLRPLLLIFSCNEYHLEGETAMRPFWCNKRKLFSYVLCCRDGLSSRMDWRKHELLLDVIRSENFSPCSRVLWKCVAIFPPSQYQWHVRKQHRCRKTVVRTNMKNTTLITWRTMIENCLPPYRIPRNRNLTYYVTL